MDDKVIYKDLSYQLVGILFEVYDELGYGYHENYYEKAIARLLKLRGIKFKQQMPAKLTFRGEIIGRIRLDFLIDDKIVLEIKKGDYFGKSNIEQILNYLKMTNLKLGILANFTSRGVKFLTILNADKFRSVPQEYNLTISKKMRKC